MLQAYAFGYESDLLEAEPIFFSEWIDNNFSGLESIHLNLMADFFVKRLQYVMMRPLDSKSNLAIFVVLIRIVIFIDIVIDLRIFSIKNKQIRID